MSCPHPAATAHARAYRFILAALDGDDTDRTYTDIGRLVNEQDCCTECRDTATYVLASFAAARIKRSATPQRWERWLTDHIAQLLDAAQQADA